MCPGCPSTGPTFESAEQVLNHLFDLKPGHPPGQNNSNLHWPSPLLIPNLGFGCYICGLLLASESRLDKHKREIHEKWLLNEQQNLSPVKS